MADVTYNRWKEKSDVITPIVVDFNVGKTRANISTLDFDNIWTNYPKENITPTEVYEMAGGKVYLNHLNNPEIYANSCPIRICLALNNSGYFVTPSSNDWNSKGDCGSGKKINNKKAFYYYRVIPLVSYINRTYSNPNDVYLINKNVTAKDIKQELIGRKGIVRFNIQGWSDAAGGHITLWNGTVIGQGDYFEQNNLHGATLISVSFWEL